MVVGFTQVPEFSGPNYSVRQDLTTTGDRDWPLWKTRLLRVVNLCITFYESLIQMMTADSVA